ncbi:MAG: hypothetical protein ACNA7V_03700 [Bacteroidales bacterium]
MKPVIGIILIFISNLLMFPNAFGEEPGKREDRRTERKERDKYLGAGPLFSFVKVVDHTTSPLPYKGYNFPGASIGYHVHSTERIKTFETDFAAGNLNTSTETPWYNPVNTSYLVVARYNILYSLNKFSSETLRWYIGPEFNINGHFRVNYKYGNSAFTFDNYNGVGVASRIEFPFSWESRELKCWFLKINRRDRDLRLSWQVSMPLVSLMVRPTYVTITNFIDPELQTKITADHINGGFLVPLNIRSQTELTYILHNQNMLRLGYIWNFYNHNPGTNKVQSAFHGFVFSFMFKFNHKPSIK